MGALPLETKAKLRIAGAGGLKHTAKMDLLQK
jgi:hypothetical protein